MPFGTIKARMGATHFLTKALPKVAAEMAPSVLAHNLTRVMNIVRIKPLIAAIVAWDLEAPGLPRPTSLRAAFTRPRPIADNRVPLAFGFAPGASWALSRALASTLYARSHAGSPPKRATRKSTKLRTLAERCRLGG
jgi:hypothetical protein